MTVGQARAVAWQWMLWETSSLPGLEGAYTAGSTNWLPDHAEFPRASDLDVMVLLADQEHAGKRSKFVYRDVLLEVSYLWGGQFESAGQVLGDYHLAPSFRTSPVLFDPLGHLTPLQATVAQGYSKQAWVRRRCVNAREKVLANLRAVDLRTALHDQIITCLFAAGITTHVLLSAGLKNPTVRRRFCAVRELLSDYGYGDFQEVLLELLGSARVPRQRVYCHLEALGQLFDVASQIITTPFPFTADLNESGRFTAIDSARDLIEAGHHREAMFWIGVTHSRCQKVLALDAPTDLAQSFKESYQELLSDLGLATSAQVRQRREEIECALPRVYNLAEIIIEANREIEDD